MSYSRPVLTPLEHLRCFSDTAGRFLPALLSLRSLLAQCASLLNPLFLAVHLVQSLSSFKSLRKCRLSLRPDLLPVLKTPTHPIPSASPISYLLFTFFFSHKHFLYFILCLFAFFPTRTQDSWVQKYVFYSLRCSNSGAWSKVNTKLIP